MSKTKAATAQRARRSGGPQAPHGKGILVSPSTAERKEFKERRRARGLTQKQLAKLAGVTNGTISNLESGRHAQVKAIMYWKVRRVLWGAASGDASAALSEEKDDLIKRVIASLPSLTAKKLGLIAELISDDVADESATQ